MEESLVQLPSQRPSTASPRQADPSSANNSTAPPSTAQPHKPPAVPPLPLHPRPPMGTSSPSILVRDEDNAGGGATDWLHSDRRLSTSSPRGKRASIVSASRDMSSRGGIGGAGASTRRVSGAATSNTAPSAAISTEFSGPPGTSMEERPEMTQLTLAQLQYIKHIFEVYDFVRMPSQIVNMSVPPPAHAKAKKRKKNRRRRRPNSKHGSRHGANSARTAISSSSDEDEPIGGAALTLPPLRRNEEEARLYRRNLLFHLIEVRPGIDDEAGGRRRDKRRYFCIPKEEEGEEDESTTPALTAAGNSTSLQSSPPDLNMIDSQPEVEEEPEEAIALDYASQLVEAQAIIKEELTRMHEWKRQQAILAEETARERSRFPDAVPTGGATHNSSAEVQLASGDVILSSAGLPFFFFAEHIVGPFFTSFFPAPNVEEDLVATLRDANTPSARVLADIWGRSITDGGEVMDVPPPLPEVLRFQPRRNSHVSAVQQLFRLMDTNADGFVSWDEFSLFVLQAGQRHLLEALQRSALEESQKRNAAALKEAQASGDAAAAAAATSAAAGAPPPSMSGGAIQYSLTFTPTPTNCSPWQHQFPLVHHLYHKQPISRLIISTRSQRYITASTDGLVKLWRLDPRLCDAQKRTAIIHERNVVSTRAPITDMCLAPPSLGDAEVVALSAMDGTITLVRSATGEVVRTLLGVRVRTANQMAAMNEIQDKRNMDREVQEFEADDLLSLRNRQPVVAGNVVRMPYTVAAYHDDAMEIFFGPTNRYFQGLEVVATTFEHLKRPVSFSSDVLYNFGAERLTEQRRRREQLTGTTSKCWFASALALGRCLFSSSTNTITEGAYLFLGFEAGALQVYPVSLNWFCVTQISATRVEPPSGRRPVLSLLLHHAMITHIVVSERSDLVMTASEDGTVCVRSFSRLEVPMLTLGWGIPQFASPNLQLGNKEYVGHSKRLTCACWNEAHHLLVTGGMDHCLFFWNSRSPRPIRKIDLRDLQSSVAALANLGACGFPVDLSFMARDRDPLRLIVLDTRRVIRLFNALSGQFMGVLVDHSPASVALGEMLVVRYEANEDRLLLGGRCVRVWDIPREEEYAVDYYGHRKPILFTQWNASLKVFVTADEDHVVMWKLDLFPNEVAIQRRDERRRQRERAREKARKDALLRRHIKWDNTPIMDEAGDGVNEKKDDDEWERSTMDDEGSDWHSVATSQRTPATEIRPHTPTDEELGLPPESPEMLFMEQHLVTHERRDMNAFNHSFWTNQARMLRSWDVEAGIRAISMNGANITSGIYVALLREAAIVQYNSFNGAALRRFAFPNPVQDVFCLYAGEAVLNQSQGVSVPLLCGAYEVDMLSGLASIYHLSNGGNPMSGESIPVISDDPEQQPKSPKATPRGAAGSSIQPHRSLVSRGSPVTSVALIPSLGLVVLGTRGGLSVSPIADVTSYAIPCRTVMDSTDEKEDIERQKSVFGDDRSRRLSVGGTPIARCPTNLMALFPGRLVPIPPTEEELSHSGPDTHHRRRSTVFASTSASTNNPSSPVAGEGSRGSNTAATDAGGSTAAAADGVVTSSGSTPAAGAGDDGAEARILEGQASIMGFLGHLQAIRDTGYILSGSNDGMLQLWNLRSMSEILRFRLTLTVEAITSISISGKEGRSSAVASSAGASARSKGPSAEASSCYSGAAGADGPSIISRNGGFYAAVGDQSGYVVLLDFHMVPWNGLTPLDMLPAGWEKDIIVLDRWRAHRKDVRGICFIDSPDVHNEDRVGFGYNCPGMDVRQGMEAQEECFFANSHSYYLPLNPITLITSSEDSYVFVWRWQRGTLHCIGCFGGGAKTHIDPPLTQPSSHAERIFEEARMSYVIRRLATEMRMFAHSRPGPEELQLVLGFMEREFATLMVEDPVLVLSTWGSLADSSAEDEELKARKGSQLRMPKIDDCVFDRAGLLTVDYHAYLGAEMPGRGSNSSTPRSLTPAAAALMAAAAATPTLLPQTESPGPAELESHAFSEAGSNSAYFGTVGSTSSVAPQFHASRRLLSFQDEPITLSPNSIYVAAFMRGTYADNTVKECLLRTIDNVRHILRRIITSQKRRSSIRSFAAADRSSARRGRGSGFRSTVSPNTNNNSPRQTPQDAGEAASTRVSTGQQRGEGLEHENEVSAADASPTTSVSGARVNFLLEANTDTAPTFASPTPREAGGVDGEDDDDDDEEDNLHKPNSPSGTMPRLATAPNGADEVDLEEENSAAQAAAAVAADEEGEEEDEEADDGEGEDEEHEAAAAASPDLPSSPPSSHDTTTDGDKPKDDKEKPMHLRGVAGKPCFRLSYGDAGGLMSSKFLLTDQEVDEAHMKAILDGVPNPPRTPRGEMLPRILRKDTRVKAAFCTPADALSTTRVSEETARANSPFGGATSNLADLEDDEALAKQPASVVMQHAYLRRRREEAVQKILEVQLRELASKPKRSKAEEQKLAIEAGLIPLSTLKDFSDTHTSTVLYGTEQVMYESEAPKELVISDAFMKGVRTNIGRVNELEKDAPVRRKVRPERLLTPRSATTTPGQVEKAAQENEEDDDDDEEGGEAAGEGEDWYAERDRMKKRRKCRQALFNPARIMLTLLDWESPVPPNSRGAGAGNRVDDRGRCGSTEPWSTWTGSSTSEELLPSIFHLPEILPKSLVEEKGPMGRQNFGSTMPSSSVGGVTMMTATTATTTEGSVAPPPLNLNAMVAEEVDAMKERMRLSLEEREEFVRQMAVVKAARETEAELEAEDRPPGLGSSTTRPTAKDFGMSMISRPPTAQANQGQFVGNTRTQSLAEIRGKGRSRPRHARFAQ